MRNGHNSDVVRVTYKKLLENVVVVTANRELSVKIFYVNIYNVTVVIVPFESFVPKADISRKIM